MVAAVAAVAACHHGGGSGDGNDRRPFLKEVGGNVEAMQVDDTGIYLAVVESSDLMRVVRYPVVGGVRTSLASAFSIQSIALDEDAVYYAAQEQVSSRVGVYRVEKRGGAPVALAMAGVPDHVDLAVDADHVYWTSHEGIMRAPKRGGTAERLRDSRADGPDGAPRAIRLGGSNVYAVAHHEIERIDKAGGPAEPVLTVDGAPMLLAVGASNDVWVAEARNDWEPDASRLIHAQLHQTSRPAEIALAGGTAAAVAYDDHRLYVADTTRGRVLRVSEDGEVETLREHLKWPKVLAVHGEWVYVADNGRSNHPVYRMRH
jgi:hypothetical protein